MSIEYWDLENACQIEDNRTIGGGFWIVEGPVLSIVGLAELVRLNPARGWRIKTMRRRNKPDGIWLDQYHPDFSKTAEDIVSALLSGAFFNEQPGEIENQHEGRCINYYPTAEPLSLKSYGCRHCGGRAIHNDTVCFQCEGH